MSSHSPVAGAHAPWGLPVSAAAGQPRRRGAVCPLCDDRPMATTGDEHEYWGAVRLRVLGSAEESGYRVVDLEWDVPAGQRLVALPHRHMDWPEHFAIVRGTARHWLGRRRLVARAGDAW